MTPIANTRRSVIRGTRPIGAARTVVILWVAVAAVIALIAALGTEVARASRLESQLADTTRALTESRLEAGLATSLIETQKGNYELARQRASEFFSGLQREVAWAGADAPKEFRDLLARRDPTITMLSRSSPESLALVQQLYTEYRAVVRPSSKHTSASSSDSR